MKTSILALKNNGKFKSYVGNYLSSEQSTLQIGSMNTADIVIFPYGTFNSLDFQSGALDNWQPVALNVDLLTDFDETLASSGNIRSYTILNAQFRVLEENKCPITTLLSVYKADKFSADELNNIISYLDTDRNSLNEMICLRTLLKYFNDAGDDDFSLNDNSYKYKQVIEEEVENVTFGRYGEIVVSYDTFKQERPEYTLVNFFEGANLCRHASYGGRTPEVQNSYAGFYQDYKDMLINLSATDLLDVMNDMVYNSDLMLNRIIDDKADFPQFNEAIKAKYKMDICPRLTLTTYEAFGYESDFSDFDVDVPLSEILSTVNAIEAIDETLDYVFSDWRYTPMLKDLLAFIPLSKIAKKVALGELDD